MKLGRVCLSVTITLIAVLGICAVVGCAGKVTDLLISVQLTNPSVAVGGTTPATAVVTDAGTPQAGRTVNFSVGDPRVAVVVPTSAVTNSAGIAIATVTGVSAGTTTLSAATAGAATATASITVIAGPTTTEYVIFANRTQSEITQAENVPGGGTIAPANVGGGPLFPETRDILGVQTHGRLALLVNQPTGGAWLRDLGDGSETAFAPAGFVPQVGWAVAAINAAGTRVYWIQQEGATPQIRAADADGGNVSTIYNEVPPADPTTIALSPDGSTLALITTFGQVRTVPVTGGAPTVLNLDAAYNPEALAWIDNTTLVVAVRGGDNPMVTREPALMRVFTTGEPSEILFNHGGAGLASTPAGVAVDRNGNILFDEEVASGNHDILRLNAPGYSASVAVFSRPEDDAQPLIMAW